MVDAVIPPATITPTPEVKPIVTPPPAAPPAEVPGIKPVTGEKKDETKPPEKTVVPEKYVLKLPENSLLDKGNLEKIEGFARENGLTNEAAQKILERESDAVKGYNEALIQKMDAQTANWIKECEADPEIGGQAFKENAELASRVFKTFGSEKLGQELEKTGLGNHPELIRWAAKIGKAMGNDKLVQPSGLPPGNPKKSTAEIFYSEKSK